jgi:hypothetical protein
MDTSLFSKKRPAEKAGFAIGSPMILPIHIVSLVLGKATKHDHWLNATIIEIQITLFIIAPINYRVKHEFAIS